MFDFAVMARPGSASLEEAPTGHDATLITTAIVSFEIIATSATAITLPAGAAPLLPPRHISGLLTNLYTFRDIAN